MSPIYNVPAQVTSRNGFAIAASQPTALLYRFPPYHLVRYRRQSWKHLWQAATLHIWIYTSTYDIWYAICGFAFLFIFFNKMARWRSSKSRYAQMRTGTGRNAFIERRPPPTRTSVHVQDVRTLFYGVVGGNSKNLLRGFHLGSSIGLSHNGMLQIIYT